MEVTCGPPSEDLGKFDAEFVVNGERIPINVSKLLMCGSYLEISKSILVVVIYSGKDTKAVLNHRKMRYKKTRFMSFFYKILYCYLALLIILSSIMLAYQINFNAGTFKKSEYLSYTSKDDDDVETNQNISAFFIDVFNLKDFIPIVAVVMVSF
tara:strand:+ start:865 stop:1326 length:462 start_codon:yes stop_codon:yes gene_type:complete